MNKGIYTVTAVIVAALLLMWYAFFNGYPMVTSDSGAYIYFAYDFQVLKDRSSFYSIWLAVAGLRTLQFAGVRGSLWVPVFFQCLLLAVLFLRYYRMLGGVAVVQLSNYLLAVAMVLFSTGVSFIAAYIMPDIFAGILLLVILLYLHDDKATAKVSWLYLGLTGVSILVHNSHFLIVPVFCVLMLLYVQVAKQYAMRRKLLKVLGVSAVCWLLVCSINAIYGFGFTLSPGSHVFMAGKLVETGTMKKYLDEQCPEQHYELCTYKDELPQRGYEYIWADNGPFQKIGGWDGSAKEHKAIIRDVFTTPRYAGDFAGTAVQHTWQQLQFIHIAGSEISFNETSSPYMSIAKHIKSELPQFRDTKQQLGKINNSYWRNIQSVILVLSMLWVGLLLIKGVLPGHIKQVYIAVILFIICNAFVAATFANVLERLQSRVFWVLPATNIFVLGCYFSAMLKKRLRY